MGSRPSQAQGPLQLSRAKLSTWLPGTIGYWTLWEGQWFGAKWWFLNIFYYVEKRLTMAGGGDCTCHSKWFSSVPRMAYLCTTKSWSQQEYHLQRHLSVSQMLFLWVLNSQEWNVKILLSRIVRTLVKKFWLITFSLSHYNVGDIFGALLD